MTPGESHNEWYQYYCSNICPFKWARAFETAPEYGSYCNGGQQRLMPAHVNVKCMNEDENSDYNLDI